jgi:energy-coupling factor transport system ATP-binding protein
VPPALPPLAIRADGATFRYAGADRPAFRDLEFALSPGEVLLVVGPSGSGKSTLARAIAGLVPGDFPGDWQGRLEVGDADVSLADRGGSTGHLPVGIVFQDPASQIVMDRVDDDVAFGLENRRWTRAEMLQRVPEALAAAGLPGFEERRTNELSGGEQQRLAIAGALAPDPGVLVLDEPTANLDPDGTRVVFDRLASLRARRRCTIVLIEHRVELAWPLADTVLALDRDGGPIDIGSQDTVLARSGERMAKAGIWLPGDDAGSAAGSDTAASEGTAAGSGGAIGSLHGVRFGFDPTEPVLRDIDLVVAPGDRVALVGPNGSGKTTLLRLALGLLRPTAGVVRLGGRDPARTRGSELARLAGYVVQDPELGFIADTVAEEVEAGLDAAEAAHARELAARLGLALERFGDRSPYRLSGGEQRRLGLVTALARRPHLLALDEPTYGQDRRGHDALVAALDELLEGGSAMLAATHDERFVRDATRRRIELADGWIVGDGAVSSGRAA